jgi:hypothetical protein
MANKFDDIINGMKPFHVQRANVYDDVIYLTVHYTDGFGRTTALPSIPLPDSDRREEFQHFVARAKGVARLCTLQTTVRH